MATDGHTDAPYSNSKLDTEVLDVDDHEPAQSIKAMLQRTLDGIKIQDRTTVHAHPGSIFQIFLLGNSGLLRTQDEKELEKTCFSQEGRILCLCPTAHSRQ